MSWRQFSLVLAILWLQAGMPVTDFREIFFALSLNMIWVAIVVSSVIILVLVYWLFFLTEGAYLGETVVVWLYDLYASRYDRIKDWEIEDEVDYLGIPFAREMGDRYHPPLILDVAAGTARLTRALRHARLLPEARWVLLDASISMLEEARKHLGADVRIHYVTHSARRLPFPDETFDVVTCLEALEFMPKPEQVLQELVRVLRPGGQLVMTNRIGPISKLMPGKTWSQAEVFRLTREYGLRNVSIRPFLVDYEWVSGLRRGSYQAPGRADDESIRTILEALPHLQ